MSHTQTTQRSLNARRASRPAAVDGSTADLHDAAEVSGGDLYKVKSDGGEALRKSEVKTQNQCLVGSDDGYGIGDQRPLCDSLELDRLHGPRDGKDGIQGAGHDRVRGCD